MYVPQTQLIIAYFHCFCITSCNF